MKSSVGTTMNDYELQLLKAWEEVFKKGQLTFWALLSLREEQLHAAQIKEKITQLTNHTISIDDQSMYRALRRYTKARLIEPSSTPNESGPDFKVYALTNTGKRVLDAFIAKNIIPVYYDPQNAELITLQKGSDI